MPPQIGTPYFQDHGFSRVLHICLAVGLHAVRTFPPPTSTLGVFFRRAKTASAPSR